MKDRQIADDERSRSSSSSSKEKTGCCLSFLLLLLLLGSYLRCLCRYRDSFYTFLSLELFPLPWVFALCLRSLFFSFFLFLLSLESLCSRCGVSWARAVSLGRAARCAAEELESRRGEREHRSLLRQQQTQSRYRSSALLFLRLLSSQSYLLWKQAS